VSAEAGVRGWDVLAKAAARAREVREEAASVRELLRVEVGGEPYALPIERVREIVRLCPITKMPRAPELVLGVISLRGEIVEVLDLRRALGATAPEPTRRSRIVVLHGETGEITGWLVDVVNEVLRVPEVEISAPPGDASELVTAICVRGDRFVSLLEPDRMQSLVAD
jgi:purine-binding chemotaxis protein CheW